MSRKNKDMVTAQDIRSAPSKNKQKAKPKKKKSK